MEISVVSIVEYWDQWLEFVVWEKDQHMKIQNCGVLVPAVLLNSSMPKECQLLSSSAKGFIQIRWMETSKRTMDLSRLTVPALGMMMLHNVLKNMRNKCFTWKILSSGIVGELSMWLLKEPLIVTLPYLKVEGHFS
ncbi:hypothetical protein QQ045_022442 [Rhodiola kirilowii]